MARKRKTFRGGEGRIVKAVLNRYEISRPAEGDRQISDDTCEQVYFFRAFVLVCLCWLTGQLCRLIHTEFWSMLDSQGIAAELPDPHQHRRMQICSHQQDQEGADECDQCRCLWCPGTSGLPKMLDVGWSVGMQRTNGS